MNIDLRSDTVTKPTPAMLVAMMQAAVGDDVFGEDPSVNTFEAKAATLFGMEAALFCPSGTMSNQIAIKCHTQQGDEVICEHQAHVFIYEGGGIAFNSGAQARVIAGDRGRIASSQLLALINPDDEHRPNTSLICLENTSNRGGGSTYKMPEIKEIKKICQEHHLKLHLDGARLFNALVANNEKASQYGAVFDSISFCLNKGLGCPVGSVLLGDKVLIQKARRIRKVFGGGMRQAGYLAAAGIYALDHHINRLQEDHHNAKLIGAELATLGWVKSVFPIETNIIIFEASGGIPSGSITAMLEKENIQVLAISPAQVRMVTHLGITDTMVQRTLEAVKRLQL